MSRRHKAMAWLPALVFSSWAAAAPVPYHLDPEQTLFAVVTHPAGAAAGLGHDHLITAASYHAILMVDEEQFTQSRFTLSAPVAALTVDPPDVAARILPRLRALGVVERAFPDLSAEDEQTTLERIASQEQLDAARNPTISARVTAIRAQSVSSNGHDFPWALDLALTVRGKTVKKTVPTSIVRSGDGVTATAVGRFRFSDYGIKPFQSAVGLIRNDDIFHVYVELVATKEQ